MDRRGRRGGLEWKGLVRQLGNGVDWWCSDWWGWAVKARQAVEWIGGAV